MEIKVENNDGIVYAFVSGSITSTNAGEFEKALSNEPVADGIIIDARKLDFISSAGLRIILGAKKRCAGKTFKVVNVNNDVKSIFDVTGFSEIMDVEGAVRQISVDGCKLIGAGACGECFRVDDETIIKLYYSRISREEIETEKALAKKAFVMGIPTAISYDIVECDGRTGVMYELIKSKTLGELIREDKDNFEKYIDMYVDVCKKVSSIKSDDPDIPSFKDLNRADLKKIVGISAEEMDYLNRFLDLVPDDKNCIHGDLNINNIMVENGECVLIDMGEFSTGSPMFDLSRIVYSMHYANTAADEYNSFYKMNGAEVEKIYNIFMEKYFGCAIEQAIKDDPTAEWLYPLAWFRCCTGFIRGDRWPKEKVDLALDLLRNNIIPFVEAHEK